MEEKSSKIFAKGTGSDDYFERIVRNEVYPKDSYDIVDTPKGKQILSLEEIEQMGLKSMSDRTLVDLGGDFKLIPMTYKATGVYRSIRRAFKRGHLSPQGVIYPKRPFNNRKDSKGRAFNMKKKEIYGVVTEYRRQLSR